MTTQPTYDAVSRNRTRATPLGGEHSHHSQSYKYQGNKDTALLLIFYLTCLTYRKIENSGSYLLPPRPMGRGLSTNPRESTGALM